MEPYRRLLERRWDNIQIKMRELEYALKTRKEEKDIIDAGRPRDEQVTMSKMVMVESAAPDSSEDLWWSAEEEEVQKTPGVDYAVIDYCILLPHTVPRCTMLNCDVCTWYVPYCPTEYHDVPYCPILYNDVLCRTVMYVPGMFHIVPRSIMFTAPTVL